MMRSNKVILFLFGVFAFPILFSCDAMEAKKEIKKKEVPICLRDVIVGKDYKTAEEVFKKQVTSDCPDRLFRVVISGLKSAGYIRNFVIDDSGIEESSKAALLKLPQKKLTKVFGFIGEFIVNHKVYSNKEIVGFLKEKLAK